MTPAPLRVALVPQPDRNDPVPAQDQPLVPWTAGRIELFGSTLATQHFDPRSTRDAPFFDALRALDHDHWCVPLGRVRPSWVFYDCVLIPGALFGYMRGGVPVSMLAVIPTLGGCDLVQSFAARASTVDDEEALARRTLRDGMAALGVTRLMGVLPWSATYFSRFLSLGALRLQTAWTPAHDEPATATFEVTHAAATHVAETESFDLQVIQRELEAGATIIIDSPPDRTS